MAQIAAAIFSAGIGGGVDFKLATPMGRLLGRPYFGVHLSLCNARYRRYL